MEYDLHDDAATEPLGRGGEAWHLVRRWLHSNPPHADARALLYPPPDALLCPTLEFERRTVKCSPSAQGQSGGAGMVVSGKQDLLDLRVDECSRRPTSSHLLPGALLFEPFRRRDGSQLAPHVPPLTHLPAFDPFLQPLCDISCAMATILERNEHMQSILNLQVFRCTRPRAAKPRARALRPALGLPFALPTAPHEFCFFC